MDKITYCIPSKSNLEYLKLAVKSIRENSFRKDHDIIIFVDSDEDGTVQWLETHFKQFGIQYFVNPELNTKLYGIGKAYDFCIDKATTEIVSVFHADMVLGQNADLEAYNLLQSQPKTVVSSTRVEPPLHPNGGEKILRNFGLYPDQFQLREFMKFVEEEVSKNVPPTDGIFAPWMVRKVDFQEIGGHDERFHSCREDSDLFNRMKLKGFTFLQSWKSLVYHFTGRGAGSFEGDVERHSKWKFDMENSSKEFIRKWGSHVLHTPLLHPIIIPKFNISIFLENPNFNLISILEPWCNLLYLESKHSALRDLYIEKTQSYTKDNLGNKVKLYDIKDNCGMNGIHMEINGENVTQELFNYVQNFSQYFKDFSDKGRFEICEGLIINFFDFQTLDII